MYCLEAIVSVLLLTISCGSPVMFKEVRMGCPVWMLALAMLCASGSEVRAQCWENTSCRDLSSDRNILVSICSTGCP